MRAAPRSDYDGEAHRQVPDVSRAAHELIDIPPAPMFGIMSARLFFIAIATLWLVAAVRRGPRVAFVRGRLPLQLRRMLP